MRASTGGSHVSAIVAAAMTLFLGTGEALAGAAPDVNADTIGCFDTVQGGGPGAVWYLSATNDPGTAAADLWTEFGSRTGTTPVTGKFGGGNVSGVGVFTDNTSTGDFHYAATPAPSSSSTLTGGHSMQIDAAYITAATRPAGFAGNFAGNGNLGFALYYGDTGVWVVDTHPGSPTVVPGFEFGPKSAANMVPLVGDWNGDGNDTVGVWDRSTSHFYLANTIQQSDTNATDEIGASLVEFSFGPAGENWIPVTGDWDLAGGDSVGLYDPDAGTFYLRDTNDEDPGGTKADYIVSLGDGNCSPVAGNWNISAP